MECLLQVVHNHVEYLVIETEMRSIDLGYWPCLWPRYK